MSRLSPLASRLVKRGVLLLSALCSLLFVTPQPVLAQGTVCECECTFDDEQSPGEAGAEISAEANGVVSGSDEAGAQTSCADRCREELNTRVSRASSGGLTSRSSRGYVWTGVTATAHDCNLAVGGPGAATCSCYGTTGSSERPYQAAASSESDCCTQCRGQSKTARMLYNGNPASCEAPAAEAGATPAPPTRTPGEFGYRNPLGSVNLNQLLGRIIRTVLGFVGALFLAMFVFGGAQWMTAGGDPKKVESGRKTLLNAVIGMVIVAVSYSLISIIFETASLIRGG